MSNLLTTMMNMPQQISYEEVNKLAKTKQIYSDCYLVSSLNSLTRTTEGREILRNNIRKVTPNSSNSYKEAGYLIHYQNVNNESKDVFVSNSEIAKLDVNKAKIIKNCRDTEENDILKAVELSMKKLIKENPSVKNLVSRLNPCIEPFENNLPSKFMKMFAGKEIIKINQNTPFLNLKFSKNKTKKLLKQIEEAGTKHHFIACTSYFNGPFFKNWHCYTITGVNTKQNSLTLYEPRQGKEMCVDIDYFINKFKFVSGYFEN